MKAGRSAHQFVSKMREDREFRNRIQSIADNNTLKKYLREEGYEFEESDLMKAMAVCMTGLDKMMKEKTVP